MYSERKCHDYYKHQPYSLFQIDEQKQRSGTETISYLAPQSAGRKNIRRWWRRRRRWTMASFCSEKRQMRRTRLIVQTRFISLSFSLYCPKLKYRARSSRDVHIYSIRSCLVFVNRTMMVSSETDIASFEWKREKRHNDSSLFSSAQNIANEMNERMNRGWFRWQTETGQIMSLSWLFTWTILLSLGMKRDDLLNDM